MCQSASSATRPPPALWQALKAEILAGLFLWYIQSLEEYEARALVLAACPIIAAKTREPPSAGSGYLEESMETLALVAGAGACVCAAMMGQVANSAAYCSAPQRVGVLIGVRPQA